MTEVTTTEDTKEEIKDDELKYDNDEWEKINSKNESCIIREGILHRNYGSFIDDCFI